MNDLYLNLPLIEWIGYLASTLVLVSLSLSSLLKLRVYNFFGSAIFSFYGFYIGALPVGIMNLLIAFFNVYYLRHLLFKKEYFDVVEVASDDVLLSKFIEFYKKDILRFFPNRKYLNATSPTKVLLALRNANVAGVFIVKQGEEDNDEVVLDYVSPAYRDYKTGSFLLEKYRREFARKGVEKLICRSEVAKHQAYLKRMGFVSADGEVYAIDMTNKSQN